MIGVWVIERRLKRKGAVWEFWTLPTNRDENPEAKWNVVAVLKEFEICDGTEAEFRVVRYGRIEP